MSAGERRVGYLLVAVACVFFAANGIAARVAIDSGLDPALVAAIRTYGGGILLLPFVIRAWRGFTRAMVLPVLGYAAIGIVISQGLYFESLGLLDVALVLAISYIAPVPIAVWERLRGGERLPGYAYGAMLAAIAGVAVAVIGGGGIGEVSALGLVLAFLTMATFAVMLVLGPKQPSGVGPFARAGAPLLVASLIWIPIAPLWQLPFDRLGETAVIAGRFPLEVPLWAVLAWILLLGSTIPFVFELAGAARIGAGASSMVSFVEPIAGSILAWVVLAQALTAVQVAGLVGTIAAVAVVEHARLRSIRVVELPDALSPLAEADPR